MKELNELIENPINVLTEIKNGLTDVEIGSGEKQDFLTDVNKAIKDLEQLRDKIEQKHKEDVTNAYADGAYTHSDFIPEAHILEAEQYYEQTHKK